MKKVLICFILSTLTLLAWGNDDFGLDPKYGSIKGRTQSLSMTRQYENGTSDPHNYSHSLSIKLDYLSPKSSGMQFGASYVGAGVLDAGDDESTRPGEARVFNGKVHVLNEAYVEIDLTYLGASKNCLGSISNTTFTIGRRVNKGEVFRPTEVRHKSRSLEGVFFQTKDIPDTRLLIGKAIRLSNIYGTQAPNLGSDFNDFGDIFQPRDTAGNTYDTEGLAWAEAVYTGVENLELAVFDALAKDVANLAGARAKFNITETTEISGLYRNESDDGKAAQHNADCYGISLTQKIGDSTTLEGGYLGVSGDSLHFEENSTGFNHPLGLSLMIDTAHFAGGAETAYLKAVTKINKTTLYALLNATWHDELTFDGQELDIVVKQQLSDSLSVAFKGGLGLRQNDAGDSDTQTDGRLFITYNF